MSSPRPVCLLTDFGTSDPYVGLMKSVLQAEPPYPPVIDLTHEVPPQSETAAAFLMEYCYPDLPEQAVVLLVVDPLVGTQRDIVAYRTESNRVVVAPDRGLVNGLPVASAFRVEKPTNSRGDISTTFHGRDWFSPAGRQLALGETPEALGPAVAPPSEESIVPQPQVDGDQIRGEIVYVDRFGNLVTNIPSKLFPETGGRLEVADHTIDRFVDTFGNHEGLIALLGSFDRLEVAVAGGSAEQRLEAGVGTPVILTSSRDED